MLSNSRASVDVHRPKIVPQEHQGFSWRSLGVVPIASRTSKLTLYCQFTYRKSAKAWTFGKDTGCQSLRRDLAAVAMGYFFASVTTKKQKICLRRSELTRGGEIKHSPQVELMSFEELDNFAGG